jgi:hypothetical protein
MFSNCPVFLAGYCLKVLNASSKYGAPSRGAESTKMGRRGASRVFATPAVRELDARAGGADQDLVMAALAPSRRSGSAVLIARRIWK